ncbi:hypothetical protein SLEP1_g24671 [Rubroshorea leprosula]|uniref:Uncharacterized protein n=1 Tax=Rubroshorea leprosula TaxID=152421 RepID=A0AAV5JNP1_9ROSI|nr:hypothetical protein SLEP1_g24671 [Rubroshorea leprosula]
MEEKKDEKDRTLNEGEAEIAISHAKRLAYSRRSPSFQYWNYSQYVMQVLLQKMLRSKKDWLKDTATVNVASSWSTTHFMQLNARQMLLVVLEVADWSTSGYEECWRTGYRLA